ncbi:MAG: radical SAM protein [Desulfuromonadaceae bacterium]|nr:radical SAM protein [Desulfuromonadaceae bacterium]MDD5104601.1 radical SAM protein [Desulfuromonadaceae bacterium]
MLLIFPPLAKAAEPPAGIVRLASFLNSCGVPSRLLDANLEGQLWLLEQPLTATDTWSRRVLKGRSGNLNALRSSATYRNPGRYRRVVSDLNRAIALALLDGRVAGGLADYQHSLLSPLRSADLIAAAQTPEQNSLFFYFSQRLPELLSGVTTVGFSLNYLSQALTTFAMIGYLRRHYPTVRIVLGGGLVTSWMQRPAWCNPFGDWVDHLISGPGEEPLRELLGGCLPPHQHITPDYTGLPLAEYFSPGLILPYSAASGCYWNRCTFCPERAEGNRYRHEPISHVISDLKCLSEQASPVLIHLLDNAISPTLLHALALDPPGIPWYGFARIDEQFADRSFCHALRRSGCVMLKLGLESGDQGVLDKMEKGIDLRLTSQVLKNLAETGIAAYCYLLFGTPGETLVEARRTLDFVVRHHQEIGFLNLAIFNMPLHGDDAVQLGNQPFYEGDLSLYTAFTHPGGWDRKQVRRFLESEFKRHPAIAVIVRNEPPFFSSNHAAFLSGTMS